MSHIIFMNKCLFSKNFSPHIGLPTRYGPITGPWRVCQLFTVVFSDSPHFYENFDVSHEHSVYLGVTNILGLQVWSIRSVIASGLVSMRSEILALPASGGFLHHIWGHSKGFKKKCITKSNTTLHWPTQYWLKIVKLRVFKFSRANDIGHILWKIWERRFKEN
jgi:hypothetical protein